MKAPAEIWIIPAGTNGTWIAAVIIERVGGAIERHPTPTANDIPVCAHDKISIELSCYPS